MAENDGTVPVATEGQVAPPAPAAEDQKAEIPAAAEAPAEKPQETPEQIEERRKQREREHNQRRFQRKATEAAEAKAEAKLLREELDRIRAAQATAQGSDEPKREAFENLEDYYRAVARWEAKQVSAAEGKKADEVREGRERQQRASQDQAELAKTWHKAEAEFQKTTKDYAEVVEPFVDGDLQELHQSARAYIVEAGPALLYDLAQNPEEAQRIAGLSPARQIAELGKREAALGTKTVKTTNAPDPAKPIGQGRAGSKDPEKMSDAEYRAHRKAQGARWAQ